VRPRSDLPEPVRHGAVATVLGFSLPVVSVALVGLNQVFNVVATIGFALSGRASGVRLFILWQIIGGLFGLGAQVTFAGIVRYTSLRFANAVGIGLAFVSAEIVASYIFFGESFSRAQWLGTALIFLGVLFIAFGR